MFLQSSSLIIILITLTLISFFTSVFLFIKLTTFMKGADAKNLEGILKEDRNRVKETIQHFSTIDSRLQKLELKMKQSIRAVETIRFNPFMDQGSNQSFSTALLDEEGNGVVLSSLFGRERVSIFAKPIQKLTSTYELTVEEKDVLKRTKAKQYE